MALAETKGMRGSSRNKRKHSSIRVDGALLDEFHLARGYWEAKDEKELAELVEGGVVVLDGGVRRLEVELGHRSVLLGKNIKSLASLR